MLPIHIARPEKHAPRSRRIEACIDSGATNCVFHTQIGEAIGLNIRTGDVETTTGVSGSSVLYMHQVSLYVPGGAYSVRAGFSAELPLAGILGMNGFFDHFKVTFNPTTLACELDRIFLV
jgi:hypothetical protein